MKLGVVLRYWPTLSETFVARELEELARRGHAVDVVALGSRDDGALAAPSDLPVLRPPRGARGLAVVASLVALRGAEARGAARWAARFLRPRDVVRALWVADRGARRGWERVHAHFVGEAAEWARVVADVLGVPFSATAHAVDLFVPRPSIGELLRAARPAITICDHHVRWIRDRYGVDAALVRCGVPLDVPTAHPEREPASFVSVARDVPKKGLDDLVAATRAAGAPLRLVSDAHRLAGPGVSVGSLPPDEVPRILARHQAFALPCRVAPSGDRDGLPVAALEAMAAGLPVVATAVAGLPEVVDDEVGWLVPPEDPLALRAAVAECARDPAARERRGRAARRRLVERGWTVERQVDRLLDAWAR